MRSYKYLGLIFTPSGEITSTLDDLRARALKAYMSMKDKLGTCFSTYLNDTIQLFDSLVKPILLYGSDYWGCLPMPKNNPIENLHLMFCKHLLGVQKHTTTNGVLLELGRVPMSYYAQKAAIKNWQRIQSGKASFLVMASYKNAELEALMWSQRIKTCLSMNGFGYTHLHGDITNVHKKLFTRQSDIFNQTALSNITNLDCKLRTYSLLKTKPGMENYLTFTMNTKYRVALTKLRLSNHELMIEKGRHKGIAATTRFCPICPFDVVEDEIHFLINCPTYNNLRKNIFSLSEMEITNRPYTQNKDKFVLLMKTPSTSIGKFIHEAMELRKTSIPENNT